MITMNTIDMILDLWDEGHSPSAIADLIGITLGEVSEVLDVEGETLDAIIEADPGEQDGDHESALASAGWGTDEDYGYYGDEF